MDNKLPGEMEDNGNPNNFHSVQHLQFHDKKKLSKDVLEVRQDEMAKSM